MSACTKLQTDVLKRVWYVTPARFPLKINTGTWYGNTANSYSGGVGFDYELGNWLSSVRYGTSASHSPYRQILRYVKTGHYFLLPNPCWTINHNHLLIQRYITYAAETSLKLNIHFHMDPDLLYSYKLLIRATSSEEWKKNLAKYDIKMLLRIVQFFQLYK